MADIRCYVDLTKAYDKVNRELLWKILRRLGIPERIVRLLISFHEGAFAQADVEGVLSSPFPLNRGLKQGSVLSPILFNIFFGALIRAFEAACAKEESKSKVSLGVHIKYNIAEGFMSPASIKDAAAPNVRSQVLYDILYADDCVLVGSSQEGMQIMVTTIDRVAREFGLEVAIKKTQFIANKFLTRKLALAIVPPPSMPAHAITRDGPAYRLRKRVQRPKAPTPTDGKPRVEIGETILEVVEQFKYLGCQDSATATLTAEIIKRKMAMLQAFGHYRGLA